MGIFERVGRVASANLNALLDATDSPEKSLDLTLREMRDQLRAGRREVVRALAAEKQLKNQVEALGREVTLWEGRAELAVRRNDDGLAREALAQKHRVAQERDRTEAERVQQRQNALEMKAEFERMERKMEEFSARQGTIAVLARQAAAGGAVGGAPGDSPLSAWQEMEDRLDHIDLVFEAQREVDEALAERRGPGGLTRAEVEAKFAALEGSGRAQAASVSGAADLEEELSQLKKKYRV
ncbi:MAG TPA: PspA/IM30 family protein [Polyangiaceae bacterium]|nr:PspA/IM30 family protein [Polyangiaceae bacterium]